MRASIVAAAGALLLVAVPAAAQDWAALRGELLDKAGELFTGEGYHALGFVHEGALEHGDSERVTLPLGAGGEIVLVGICDADCSDLDLTLHDPGGSQLDTDVETDDVPIVMTEPRRTGRYSMTVRMAECAIDPCRYAVQMFVR